MICGMHYGWRKEGGTERGHSQQNLGFESNGRGTRGQLVAGTV
jgi:hypothetical protein